LPEFVAARRVSDEVGPGLYHLSQGLKPGSSRGLVCGKKKTWCFALSSMKKKKHGGSDELFPGDLMDDTSTASVLFIRQTLETSFRASTPARSCQKRPPLKQNTHIGHGACCSTAVAANSMWNATWPAVHSIKAGTQKSVTACACQVPKCRAPERGQRGPSKTPHAPTPSSTWNLALA
jgi:hypothetical protein